MIYFKFIKIFFKRIFSPKYKHSKIELSMYCIKELKKSLKIRVIDAGDDEGTIAEIYAMEGPYYSIEKYGIGFTASPKHADGLMIIGSISKNMKDAILQAWEVIPNPKVLIACGDGAIYGDKRFKGTIGGVEVLLEKMGKKGIDLQIPGKHPSAKIIFDYLVSFIGK